MNARSNSTDMLIPTEADSVDVLRAKASKPVSNDDVILASKTLKDSSFVGIAKNLELLADIRRWRKFFTFSSFYGHRLGRGVSIVGDLRQEGFDLYCSDQSGYIKNSPDAPNAETRIGDAKRLGIPVVAFFGGSTMMGQGARFPQFAIPSLVEQVLRTEHGLPTVCVNFGVGAWMSSDSLHLLMHEVLPLKPDLVVFYDGWNCCSYLTSNQVFREANHAAVPVSYVGTQPRHIENDLTLSYQFRWPMLFIRSFNLLVNQILSGIASLVNSSFAERIANIVLSKVFSIRSSTDIHRLFNEEMEDEKRLEGICDSAANEYLRIHRLADSLCKAHNSLFVTCLQPLVFFGKKQLTDSEIEWRNNGYSSGNPLVFLQFYQMVKIRCTDLFFRDLTDVFDDVRREVYIDSGHLNRFGNLVVAERLAKLVAETLPRTKCSKR